MLEFGQFRLDPDRQILWREGQLVPIGPKVVQTLAILAASRGQVVSKDHLIRQVWGDTAVEENSLAHNIFVLRKILKEDSSCAFTIETIPRRGYRFCEVLPCSTGATSPVPYSPNAAIAVANEKADVRSTPAITETRFHWGWAGFGVAALALLAGIGLGIRVVVSHASNSDMIEPPAIEGPVASLAILPYYNASGDRSLNWMASVLPETLGFDFGESERLRLVSPGRLQQVMRELHVSTQSKLDASTLTRVAELTHAESVISGKYEKVGGQILISSTILNAKPYRHVEIRTDASEEDLGSALDGLAEDVRKELALAPEILNDVQAHWRHVPILAMRAYDEGTELANSGNNAEAIKKFQEATSHDPNFALAYSMLGQTYATLGRDDEAEQASRRAVELSKNLSPQERYLLEANHARIMSDRAKIAAYESLSRDHQEASGTHLRLIEYIVWLAPPMLQIGVLVVTYKRGLYRGYPLFTIYLLFDVISDLFLFVAHVHFAFDYYYYGYWATAVLSNLISCGVIYEILSVIFLRDGVRRKQTPMVGALALVLLLMLGAYVVAAVRQVQHTPFDIDIVLIKGTLLGERGVRLLECGLALSLFVLDKRLGVSRRQFVFGIALGLGFFAAVNVLVSIGFSHRISSNFRALLSGANSAAYLISCLIWLAYTVKAPVRSEILWANSRSPEKLVAS